MTLRLYNTLTHAKEDFVPLDPAHVRLYVCGPTVYDRAHVGNARPLIVFDVLFRLLRHLYGADGVNYVRNITDVDDKINARAAERGVEIGALTQETTRVFHEDAAALACLRPNVEPRATDHVEDMKRMIETLVRREVAYVAEQHVLFSVAAMNARNRAPRYGALSRRSLDEMIAGARVEVAPYKRDPADFVLWKPSKPGEPAWDSPCGIGARGRPGWHIECSAMSFKHLVEAFAGAIRCEPGFENVFDIHGGEIDLVFPHHENEIAQSCCALDSALMARVWMHNGFLQVEGEKMAKSAGNFVTIRELLEQWNGEVIRLSMLKSHYRQPIDFKRSQLKESADELRQWALLIGDSDAKAPAGEPSLALVEALKDDLNTPEALAVLRSISHQARSDHAKRRELRDSCRLVGLLREGTFGAHVPGAVAKLADLARYQTEIEDLKRAHANGFVEEVEARRGALKKGGATVEFRDDGYLVLSSDSSDSEIEDLLRRRADARARKNWSESDHIRDQLASLGIELEDHKDGTTTWKVKP